MRYRVTLDGIPVGAADLVGAPRAVGTLVPTASYSGTGLRKRARRLGVALRLLASRRVAAAVVGRALGGAVAHMALLQDRFGIEDEHGRSVAIIHVLVVELPRDRLPMVVVQLREQAAPVLSENSPQVGQPGSQSRPAA